jgi:SMC interacting uncharacterized protein involved in chromosome segregation
MITNNRNEIVQKSFQLQVRLSKMAKEDNQNELLKALHSNHNQLRLDYRMKRISFEQFHDGFLLVSNTLGEIDRISTEILMDAVEKLGQMSLLHGRQNVGIK